MTPRRVLLWMAVLAIGSPPAGQAQTRVTLCSSDTQSGPGMNLAQALAQGGVIGFECPAGATIRMTTGHNVPSGTTIDGGGRVTLDAHGTPMTMFFVERGSLSLRAITIRGARQRRTIARTLPSVAYSTGELVLEGVTIEASESPVLARGGGRVTRSNFTGNQGWAVNLDGNGLVEQSTFIANGTGLSIKAGTVRGSVFSQHTAGALRVTYPQADVRITANTFERNAGEGALVLSQRAGRDGNGVVIVNRCTFRNNSNGTGGGAVTIYDTTAAAQRQSPVIIEALRRLPPARFVIMYSRFEGNEGRTAGAIRADLANTRGLTIRGGIFLRNTSAESGGAISWQGRSLLVTHSIFRLNAAAATGAALFARMQEPQTTWAVANSLVVENSAGPQGAAIDADAMSVINVTIARNRSYGIANVTGARLIANTLLDGNQSGNCLNVSTDAFQGPNLQHGASDCSGVPVQDPELDALYIPSTGSVARAAGDLAICRADPVSRTDLLFQSRGTRPYCAVGAFERPPVRRIPRRRG